MNTKKIIKIILIIVAAVLIVQIILAFFGLAVILQKSYGASVTIDAPDKERSIELKDWSYISGMGVDVVAHQGKKLKEVPSPLTEGFPIEKGDYEVEWKDDGSATVYYCIYKHDKDRFDKNTWAAVDVTFDDLKYPRYYNWLAVGAGVVVCAVAAVVILSVRKRKKKAAAQGNSSDSAPGETDGGAKSGSHDTPPA